MEELALDARTKLEESMDWFNTDMKEKFVMESIIPTMGKSTKAFLCFHAESHPAPMESNKLVPMDLPMILVQQWHLPPSEPLAEQPHQLELPTLQLLHQAILLDQLIPQTPPEHPRQVTLR